MCSTHPSDFGLEPESCYNQEATTPKLHKHSHEIKKQLHYQENNMHSTVHPQLLNEPQLFIPVTDVIHLFFEAEGLLWNRIVNSPFPLSQLSVDSCSSILTRSLRSPFPEQLENDSTEFNTLHQLIGEAFLAHSKSCQAIHEFFVKLDPKRCCLNVREVDDSVNVPRQLKRVKSSSAEEKKRSSHKAKKVQVKPQRSRATFIHKLSVYEERIYKQMLQCAFQPVLSCPIDEPSLFSPVTCSPDATKRRDQRRTYAPRDRQRADSSIDSVAIDPTMLFTKVMHAFRINLDYHTKLKDQLRRSLPNRDTAKALAVDLMDQLYRLQANEAIFYRRDVFADHDCYEDWRSQQQNFVEKLINKWCPENTDIRSYKLDPFDAHEALKVLVEKFLRLDLNEKLAEIRNGPKNQSVMSVLTTASKKLLKEFCLRYGVGRIYKKIRILESMIQNLDYTDWYLSCLETTLMETMDDIAENERLLVKRERELIRVCIMNLHCKIEYGFVKIYTLYPRNISEEGVELLLTLLSSVIETKVIFQFWDLDDEPNISNMLQQYIKLAVIENYKLIKEKSELDCIENGISYDTTPTAEVLCRILQDMRRNFSSFQELCSKCLLLTERCKNILKVVAGTYYSEFMADVKELCYTNTATISTSQVDYQMMGLAYRLDTLHQEWIRYIHPRDQKWRNYYKVVLTVAIRAITEYIMQEVPNNVTKDDFKFLKLSSCIPHYIHSPIPIATSVRHPNLISSELERRGSSAFTAVRSLREMLRKGSLISIEGNIRNGLLSNDSSRASSINENSSGEDSSAALLSSSAVPLDTDSLSTGDIEGHVYDEVDINNEQIESAEANDVDSPITTSMSDENNNLVDDRNASCNFDFINKQNLNDNDFLNLLAVELVNDIINKVINDLEKENHDLELIKDEERDVEVVVRELINRISAELDTNSDTGIVNGNSLQSQPSNTISSMDCTDYRTEIFRPLQVDLTNEAIEDGSLASNLVFDNNPHNEGVVRRRVSNRHTSDADDEDDLMQEVTFHNRTIHDVKKRPSSQPIPWDSTAKRSSGKTLTQVASRYSMEGPLTDNNHDVGSIKSFDHFIPPTSESSVAHSYDSNKSWLEENKKFNQALQSNYKATVLLHDDLAKETTIPNRLKKHRQSLQCKKLLVPQSDDRKSRSLSNLLGEEEMNKKSSTKTGKPEDDYNDGGEDTIFLPRNGLIMTTSSLTDVLITCARLISFSKGVCSLIIPSSQQTKAHFLKIDRELEDQYYNTRIDTLSKVLTSIKDIVKTYTSALLSLDVCGSKLFENNETFDDADKKLLKELKMRHEELIPGCRHCFTLNVEFTNEEDVFKDPCVLLNRLLNESLGSWELVTKEMCFRINNIHSLIKLLPPIQQHAADSLQVDLEPLLHECDSDNESSTTYSTIGPSDTSATFPTRHNLCFELKPAHQHLNDALRLQIKLLTCRVIDIFNKLFDALFVLPLNNRPIHEHMARCKHHLLSQMKFFHHALYKDCVQLVTLEIWKSIIKKYHGLLDTLHMAKDDPRAKGMKLLDLLVDTRNHLMATKDLEPEFYNLMKPVLFRLELFSLSLEKLRMVYEQTQSLNVIAISTGSLQLLTFEEIVHLIKHELRSLGRPSFTGKALTDVLANNVTWLNRLVTIRDYNHDLSTQVKATLIAQFFLRNNIIKRTANFPPPARRNRNVVMATPSSDPVARYTAPVHLLDANTTIDVLSNDENIFKSESSAGSSSGTTKRTFAPGRFREDFEEQVSYTFHTGVGSLPDIELTGKLHSIVRSEGTWINEAIQQDIIAIYRYAYKFARDEQVVLFFIDFALERPQVRCQSCLW